MAMDFNFASSIKVMWADESRFILFLSNGQGKKASTRTMHPSFTVATVQACGGNIMIWAWFNWSGLGSAMLCGNKIKSAEYLNDQVIPAIDFF